MLKVNEMKKYILENVDLSKYNYWKIRNYYDKVNDYNMTIIEKTLNYKDYALDIVYEEYGWNINLVNRDKNGTIADKMNMVHRLKHEGINIIENPRSIYNDNIHINLFELPADATYEEITEKVISILDVLFKD